MLRIVVMAALASSAAAGELKFRAAEGGEFSFDTGVLSGKLHAGGKSLGLSSVVHAPTGAALSRGMGLFSHYRVFAANRRYGGGAWDWPSEATLRPDGAVEVRWRGADDRPFEMWAVYRWAGPATLDVETRVQPREELKGFESFLASYFAPQFSDSLVYAQGVSGAEGRPVFLAADKSHGVWQMFPRDREALTVIHDGRWKIPPSPVDWAIRPLLAQPIGLRRDPASGLTAVLMASPVDCFAVSTPFQGEGHYSMYLSLFGRTLRPGQTARARARLVIAVSPSEEEVFSLYRAFLKTAR
ncbi:MAG: hypothetical protein FJW34_10970 [Acidobacteria bacterium]|nr:hypothetical protein [Acidobacteriota bacterium]